MNDLAELIKTRNNVQLEEKLSINPSMAHGKTEQGITLLQFAAYYRNQEAVEIIKRYKGELDIFEAATVGDQTTLQRKVKSEQDNINAFSSDGFTPLGLAAYFGHVDAVKFLLDAGADPQVVSSNAMRVTPLHSACATSNYDIAEILIHAGVNVNVKQHGGITPLHSAAHNGQPRLARLLIDHGADINARTDSGQSPKDMALEKGHAEVVVLLS